MKRIFPCIILFLFACSSRLSPTMVNPTPEEPPPVPTSSLNNTPKSFPFITATTLPEPTIPLQNLTGVPYPTEAHIQAAAAMADQSQQWFDKNNSLEMEERTSAELLTRLIYEQRDNLNDPNNTPIVFAHDPITDSIILTARHNPITNRYEWKPTGLRDLSDALGIQFSTVLNSWFFINGQYVNVLKEKGYVDITTSSANHVLTAGEFTTSWAFDSFTSQDWERVITEWESIKKQLDTGVIPQGFPVTWDFTQELIDFAKAHNLSIRARPLLWCEDVPDTLYYSGFSNSELAKILEFTVKVKVLKYKGIIDEWDCADEAVNAMLYGNNRQRFWYDRLGGNEIIYKVCLWANQADPEARLVIVEDHVLETSFLQPQQRAVFMQLLKDMKARNIPVSGVGIENNFWIYDPPSKDLMVTVLKEIQQLGYTIAAPETTISISSVFPSWESRPKVLQSISDPLNAQATIYADTLEAYLEVGAGFGLGDTGDAYSWHLLIGHPESRAMLFDEENRPKPAYFAIKRVLEEQLDKSRTLP